MKSKYIWQILRHLRKVWVRVVSFALLAVITVLVSQVVAPVIPSAWTYKIGAESVDQVLNILASSMLAVTTFSLAIAISAFSAAASTATPRATALLQKDPTTQNVLATFLGAFLFSLVGIIALQGGYYTNAGRLVLFAMTGLVIVAVVVALLGWISHLMTFGRMSDTLERVEAAATQALKERLKTPYLGGNPLHCAIPSNCSAISSSEVGYVQHIDVEDLNICATELKRSVWLAALPGAFVHESRPLFFVDTDGVDDELISRMQNAFTIGDERDFEQDPRFGLIVISEIASRALSPAVNDPGTAIDVVGRLVRILSFWKPYTEEEIVHEAVFVPPIEAAEMIEDAFRPIMRDGAAIVEVQLKLKKALDALSTISPTFAEATKTLAADQLSRAQASLTENEYRLLGEFGSSSPEKPNLL